MSRLLLIMLLLVSLGVARADRVIYYDYESGAEISPDEIEWHFYIQSTYDDRGLELSRAYFDDAGEPWEDAYGVHLYNWTYDSAGKRDTETCYNAAGQKINPW